MREFCLGCDTNLVRSIARKVLQPCSAAKTDLLNSAHFQFEQCKIYVLSQNAINAPFLDRSRNRKPKHFGAEFFPRNLFLGRKRISVRFFGRKFQSCAKLRRKKLRH